MTKPPRVPEASLSSAEARRISLSAQGFSAAPRLRKHRPFDESLNRLHVLQIDSVNVFARSHYLPVFSRNSNYATEELDAYLWQSGEFTEYWAHEAAFIPVGDRELFGWRMADFAHARHEWAAQHAPVIARVRAGLAAEGPQFVRELETEPRGPRGPWWDWSTVKHAVEYLFATGEVVSTGRVGFQRKYALESDALRPEHTGCVPRAEAQQRLVERAARSLGVGTLADIADYHRLKKAEAHTAITALEQLGTLIPVSVESWVNPQGAPLAAWMHRDATVPARLAPDALLTPFDPLVWFRPRAERLFNFHYRIEIYTPKEKRRYGYYCLPLMVGGQMAGRIDLKADRRAKTLLVQAAWQEQGAPKRTTEAATTLLARAAQWQGLTSVSVSGVGNLQLPRSFDAAN